MRLLRAPENQTINQRNVPLGAYQKIETVLMKRTLLFLAAFTSFTIALQAAPTPTPNPKRAS
jgi:hypothetical protein